jgi:uncharacterized protein (DUF58 family)
VRLSPARAAGRRAAPRRRRRRRPGAAPLDGPWRRGDSLRQVAWKKLARHGELVSREGRESARRELWLDWSQARQPDTETRLSRLAAWVLLADAQGMAYGLRLPGRELAPADGAAHRHAALAVLATWT